jgi:hypothetical protein
MDIVSVACVTGFVGDALLQTGIERFQMGGPTGWGLKEYFKQHGRVEALFIPGGMLALFFVVYVYTLKLPLTYTNLAIYGVVLDFIFRKTMLFPSLDKYYEYFNYFWSAVWGAIPMVIPLMLLNSEQII